MSATDNYFQFPLILLAYGATADRPDSIIGYCVGDAGRKEASKLTREQQRERVATFSAAELPGGFRLSDPAHVEIVLGMAKVRVFKGGVDWYRNTHAAAQNFVVEMAAAFGGSPLVRVRTEFVWEVKMGTGMTYRDFAVLCGVYSVVGEKRYPVLITHNRIRAGALGYKSGSLLFDKPRGPVTDAGARLLESRADGARPLSPDQLRYTLDTTESKGLLVRASPNARQTYFSHRMSTEDMHKKLFDWKTRRAFKEGTTRDADRQLQLRIKEVKRTARSPHAVPTLIAPTSQAPAPELSPHAVPTKSPQSSPHSPHALPTGVPTLIQPFSEKLPSEKLPSEKLISENLPSYEQRPAREKIRTAEPEKGEEAGKEPAAPTTPPRRCSPPSRDEAEAMPGQLVKGADMKHGTSWWDQHGDDERWLSKDWKPHCRRFVMDAVGRENREKKWAGAVP